MNRKISFAPGEFYHIYNRGNDKRKIFLDEYDYERFIKLLFFSNSSNPVNFRHLSKGVTFAGSFDKRGDTLFDIGAYCLMPNHFHLLVHAKNDGHTSLFMKKLCTAYSMYFNLKYTRTGKLFEGPFLATHADSDEYLKYLVAYIHLNPIKIIEPEWKERGLADVTTAEKFLHNYRFSSHNAYANPVEDNLILNKEAFPAYFDMEHDIDAYNLYLKDWLTLQR